MLYNTRCCISETLFLINCAYIIVTTDNNNPKIEHQLPISLNKFILLFIERNKCNVYLIIAQIFHTTIF